MLVGVLEVNCISLSAALFSGSFCCVDKETLITVEEKWEKYAVMVEDLNWRGTHYSSLVQPFHQSSC